MTHLDVLDAVQHRFGFRFGETMTGGGCMALEVRLESGHWLIATDDALMGFRRRCDWERENDAPMGWSIGIYPHGGDDVDWSGMDSIVDVVDLDAYAADLPVMVGKALEALASMR